MNAPVSLQTTTPKKRIYFMRPVGQIGPIKVGCSRFPERRLETYTPWSPIKLEIIATAPGSHENERQLHSMFGKDWMHHEWFAASKELLALIDHVQATGQLPELPKVITFKKPRVVGKRGPRKPGARPLSPKLIELGEAVRGDYEAGRTLQQIAEERGMSPQRIVRALDAVGVKRRPRGAPKTGPRDTDRAMEFTRRYNGGETLQQIADDFGVTRERVRQILRKAGVPSLGNRKEHRRKAHELTEVEIEAVRLYGALSPMEIAAKTGITPAQQLAARKRLGVQSLPKGSFLKLPDYERKVHGIAEAYKAGKPPREIARDFGFPSSPYIYRFLKAAGVNPNIKPWAGKHRRGGAA